jgi:tetratricopeptide (TPR) repeat protein
LERISGSDATRHLARSLALAVRAEAALAAGRAADALRLVERAEGPPDLVALTYPLGSQARERYARAEALRALGRHDEALAWYATLGQTELSEVVFLAPAHLRQGEIYEERGEMRRAAAHYGQVLALWQNADPPLQPLVADVRRRLTSMRATR